MDFVRSHFEKMQLCSTIQVPFCEEKSVQLVRVAFFRSDFLQNPYFSYLTFARHQPFILSVNPEAFFYLFLSGSHTRDILSKTKQCFDKFECNHFLIKDKVINGESDLNLI